jgi:hypothetical protein
MEPENRLPALVFTHPGIPLPTSLQHGLLDALAYALIPWYGYLPAQALAITATIGYSNHICSSSPSSSGHDDEHRYTRYEVSSLMGYAAQVPHVAQGILPFLRGPVQVEYSYTPTAPPYVSPDTHCWAQSTPTTILL